MDTLTASVSGIAKAGAEADPRGTTSKPSTDVSVRVSIIMLAGTPAGGVATD